MQKGSQQSNKNQGARRPTAPAKSTATRYLSIQYDEMAKMRQLGFRERWAYLELKAVSNWKVGTCGEFREQKLSYTQIAAMITAPGVQGRGLGSIDDTQAADFLKSMEVVGLVANIGRRDNGGLRFDMPMAPIQRKITELSGEVGATQSGKVASISPDEVIVQTNENPTPTWGCDKSAPSLSVMINKELNISIDGAESAGAEAAPCRATGAGPAWENPAAQPQAAAPLTARQIQDVVAGSWSFDQTDTPEALALYASWADVGISLLDLHRGMTSLDEDQRCAPSTPADLGAKLWGNAMDGWER